MTGRWVGSVCNFLKSSIFWGTTFSSASPAGGKNNSDFFLCADTHYFQPPFTFTNTTPISSTKNKGNMTENYMPDLGHACGARAVICFNNLMISFIFSLFFCLKIKINKKTTYTFMLAVRVVWGHGWSFIITRVVTGTVTTRVPPNWHSKVVEKTNFRPQLKDTFEII